MMSQPITGSRTNWRRPTVLLGIPLALLAVAFLHGAAPVPGTKPTEEQKDPESGRIPSVERMTVEVRFSDNSRILLTPQTDVVALSTRYGKLSIPLTEINKIVFAT